MTKTLLTESDLKKNTKIAKTGGVRVVVTDDFHFLVRIESAKGSLTPWLRRRNSVSVDIPTHLRYKATRMLSAREFLRIASAARTGKTQNAVEVRVHEVGKSYAVHVGVSGGYSAYQAETMAELKSFLKKIERRYSRLHVSIAARTLGLLVMVHSFLPSQCFSFEYERGLLAPVKASAPLRSVLIFTNIVGAPLEQLEGNLPFWSKGLSGFRFRHVFGQLTAKRVESTLMGPAREWDILVYRGHGEASAAGITWKLLDGEWVVPPGIAQVYVHASCLPDAGQLPLDKLPAGVLITPLTYLSDFDDSVFMRALLERYKASGNIQSAMRAIQADFSQFVVVSG